MYHSTEGLVRLSQALSRTNENFVFVFGFVFVFVLAHEQPIRAESKHEKISQLSLKAYILFRATCQEKQTVKICHKSCSDCFQSTP